MAANQMAVASVAVTAEPNPKRVPNPKKKDELMTLNTIALHQYTVIKSADGNGAITYNVVSSYTDLTNPTKLGYSIAQCLAGGGFLSRCEKPIKPPQWGGFYAEKNFKATQVRDFGIWWFGRWQRAPRVPRGTGKIKVTHYFDWGPAIATATATARLTVWVPP